MKDEKKQDLIDVVNVDKQHIINYLRDYNLKISGVISMLFSENLDSPKYFELWELESEPALVKVEFKVINPLNLSKREIQGMLKILIDKIVERAWPDNPLSPYEYTTPIHLNHTHYRSIKFNNGKVTLIGGLCYCH